MRAFNPIALGFNSLHAHQRGSVNCVVAAIGSLGEQACVGTRASVEAVPTCKAQVAGGGIDHG